MKVRSIVVSVTLASSILFHESSHAKTLSEMVDIVGDKVMGLLRRAPKASPAVQQEKDLQPINTHSYPSINIKAFDSLNGTISIPGEFYHRPALDLKNAELLESKNSVNSIRNLNQSMQEMQRECAPIALNGIRTAQSDAESSLSSSGSFSSTSSSFYPSASSLMDDSEEEETVSGLIYDTQKNRFKDTFFLNASFDEKLKEKLWYKRLIERGKANEVRKHPYRGFINIIGPAGERIGDLIQGHRALFQMD